jgi:ElaB/YqjD/DUF883 family membrane-anchored ribosome-binding protein
MGFIWAGVLGNLLVIRSVRKAIFYGIGIGAVVGLVIAIVERHWQIILIGCGIGLVLGVTLVLIIRAVSIMKHSDQ